MKPDRELNQLRMTVETLRAELEDARETLAAIQSGAADALVIETPDGPHIFTLQGAEYSYRALIEQMREGAVTLKSNGIIHYCNRGFADMLKLPLEQVIGTPVQRYVAEADRAVFEAMLRQGIADSAQGEMAFQAADGSLVPAYVGFSSLEDTAAIVPVSMVVTNLIERKQTEHTLASAQYAKAAAEAAAEAASKAKDHFLAVLSHELRTPLTPVVATVSMLQEDPRLDANTRESLEMIRRNVELEARLIDDLLDLTRIEKGKIELNRESVDLCTILRHSAEVCLPDIEARKLEFGIDAPDGPYLVDADPARLQQVFWNLLKNSIKFTPPGGCIGIRCRRDSGHVVAEVNDSGEGIDPELLPRLFNAFEQGGRRTTQQFGGLGLGLAISKAIVDMHGGTLTARSEGKGKGATFSLRLPLLATEAAVLPVPTAPQAPSSANSVRPIHILLVEDHGDTARIMHRLLSADGHEVQIAADVATALKLIMTRPFDLLISDLGLPDGSGLELMQKLRAKGLKLPGIALSGYGQEQDVQQSREAGFSAHLIKPVSLPKLKETIAKVVRKSGYIPIAHNSN